MFCQFHKKECLPSSLSKLLIQCSKCYKMKNSSNTPFSCFFEKIFFPSSKIILRNILKIFFTCAKCCYMFRSKPNLITSIKLCIRAVSRVAERHKTQNVRKLRNACYLRLYMHINDKNTHQTKNVKLPYLHCYTRNICEIWKRMYEKYIRKTIW